MDTGKIRYVTRHLAFIGDASTKAAEAFEAVYAQSPDKAWAFRDLMFQNQDKLRSAGSNVIPLLESWAGQVGVDQARFNSDLESGKHADVVQRERQTATQLKVPGTPTIFVGDKMIEGAGGGVPTVAEIGQAIDQAIAQQQGR